MKKRKKSKKTKKAGRIFYFVYLQIVVGNTQPCFESIMHINKKMSSSFFIFRPIYSRELR